MRVRRFATLRETAEYLALDLDRRQFRRLASWRDELGRFTCVMFTVNPFEATLAGSIHAVPDRQLLEFALILETLICAEQGKWLVGRMRGSNAPLLTAAGVQ